MDLETAKELFLDDKTDKQLHISFSGGMITNSEIHDGKFELTETLCSERELRFGACEASELKLTVSNIVSPLKGKRLYVYDILNGDANNSFRFGEYEVFSDVPTADRRKREITAYDFMYLIINADVANWYNAFFEGKKTATLKEFRDSFLAYFGITQEEAILVNDDMVVTKTIEPTSLSGKTVITAICEINGCFGHIGRDSKFQYIFLKEMEKGLYPSETLYPSENLYPYDEKGSENVSKNHYIKAEYEDYVTAKINKLQIRQEEDDIGVIYGDGDNCYIVQDNFLLYGMSSEDLTVVAKNMYSVISTVTYRPARIDAKGNPCLNVGDGIRLATRYEVVRTYILQRTLKGIQALRDRYDAEGEEVQSEKVNSVNEQINQLKGKTNVLKRTIEETQSTISDVNRNLSSQITQNAEAINLKVSKDNIISEINQTAEAITISAQRIDLVGLVQADELVSKFATIDSLHTTVANINHLISQKAEITDLNATNANVDNLTTRTLNLENAIINKADISSLNAVQAQIDKLDVSTTDTDMLFGKNAVFYQKVSINTLIFQGRQVSIQAVNGVNCLTVGASTD